MGRQQAIFAGLRFVGVVGLLGVCVVQQPGRGAPPAETTDQTQPAQQTPAGPVRPLSPTGTITDRLHVSDKWTCICDDIRAGGVGWCGRHSRGFAYGHTVRTWALFRTLLAVDEAAGSTANAPGPAGSVEQASQDEGTGDEPRTYGTAIRLLNRGSLLKMLNAFPRGDGGSQAYRLSAIPGYCDADACCYLNGRAYRSWVVVAMEAGRPLPALDNVGRAHLAGGEIPTSQPSQGTDAESSMSEVLAPPDCLPSSANLRGAAPVPGCEYCKKAFAAGAVWTPEGFPAQPFCEKCGVGVVAGRVFIGREAFELAKAADAALAFDRLHRCERCGVAILVGGRCNVCSECKQCHVP